MPIDTTAVNDFFQVFLKDWGQAMAAFSAVFALLNCFLGLKLIKTWVAVVGFLIGFILGFTISLSFLDNAGICVVIGLAAGLLLGALAFIIYKAGVFLFCMVLTFTFVLALVPKEWPGWIGITLGIVLGLGVGVLALLFMRPVIILSSGISGSFSAVSTMVPLFGIPGGMVTVWIAGIVIAAAGIFVQFKTTSKKDLR